MAPRKVYSASHPEATEESVSGPGIDVREDIRLKIYPGWADGSEAYVDILTDRTDISYGDDLAETPSDSENSSYREGCRLEIWENDEWTTLLEKSRLNVISVGNRNRMPVMFRINYSSLTGSLQPGVYRLLIPVNIGEEHAVLAAPFTFEDQTEEETTASP